MTQSINEDLMGGIPFGIPSSGSSGGIPKGIPIFEGGISKGIPSTGSSAGIPKGIPFGIPVSDGWTGVP